MALGQPVPAPYAIPEVSDQPRVIRAFLLMIAAKHPSTFHHLRRVSAYAETLARWHGLSDRTVKLTGVVGLLHDLGKVAVPDQILTKPGRLTDEEVDVMMSHAVRGADVLAEAGESEGVVRSVRHHHEWFNGQGYPDNLAGAEIPICARIVGIVDAFDTMTTPRPYRTPVPVDAALAELLRCRATQFDPELTESFVAMISTYGPLQDTWNPYRPVTHSRVGPGDLLAVRRRNVQQG